jgi:pimeloyl-ACP methyl ester carboxylesterase
VQRDAQDVDRRPGELDGDAAHERGGAAVAFDDVPVAVYHDRGVGLVAGEHLDAYLRLMRGDDHGRAFLQVMRGPEQSRAKQALYRGVVGDRSRPVQVVWAADDPALALATYGEQARQAAGLDVLARIPGKHFPQEDQPAVIF